MGKTFTADFSNISDAFAFAHREQHVAAPISSRKSQSRKAGNATRHIRERLLEATSETTLLELFGGPGRSPDSSTMSKTEKASGIKWLPMKMKVVLHDSSD